MDTAKTSSGRTTWSIAEGRLYESSPDSYPFMLLGVDTEALLDLLMRNEAAIRKAAEKERAEAIGVR